MTAMGAGLLELPRQAADLERVASNGRASTTQTAMNRRGVGLLQSEQQKQPSGTGVAGNQPACKGLSMPSMPV